MEKFGIFDLLDALSAIAGVPDAERGGDTDGAETSETANAVRPSRDDAAFRAPDFPAGNTETPTNESAPESPTASPAPAEEENAFTAFINRHNAIASKIDKH